MTTYTLALECPRCALRQTLVVGRKEDALPVEKCAECHGGAVIEMKVLWVLIDGEPALLWRQDHE
jgi:hypothetical protein